MFVDKTLTCRDCGSEFVFTVSEQEFFKKKDAYQDLQYKYFEERDFGSQKGGSLQDIKIEREGMEAESYTNIIPTLEKIKKS